MQTNGHGHRARKIAPGLLNCQSGHKTDVEEIRSTDMLSAEEEYELACRYRDKGDERAKSKLVNAYMPKVRKKARRFAASGLSKEDLTNEGAIGLIEAVERFDPEEEARLGTYAEMRINKHLIEYAQKNRSIVKTATTKNRRKVHFKLRKIRDELGVAFDKPLTDEQAAEAAVMLQVSVTDVIDIDQRFVGSDKSLDAPCGPESDDTLLNQLAHDAPGPDQIAAETDAHEKMKALLAEALNKLNELDRYIVKRRWFEDEKVTLETIAEELGRSRERIRQREKRAFWTIQKHIEGLMSEDALAAMFGNA